VAVPADLAEERYGRGRRSGGRAVWVAGVVLALAGVAGLWWLGRDWVDPPVRSGMVSFGDITDESISVVFDVRRDAGIPVTCVFELTTATRLDTRQSVVIPPGSQTSLRVEHTFQTRQPVAAKLLGCRTPGQTRLH